ncbi:hypothetical protein ACMD2_00674, partial [Ananas comosus]
ERKADGEWLNGSRDSLEEVTADKIQVNYDRTVIVVIGGLMLHGGHVERRERRGSVAPKLRLHPTLDIDGEDEIMVSGNGEDEIVVSGNG